MSARHEGAIPTLAKEFWSWRARQQPRSRDDIPRLERPAGWLPAWSQGAIERYRVELKEFQRRHAEIAVAGAPVGIEVDHALIGSALARVRYELDVLQPFRRQPSFWVDQSLGVLFDRLLSPPPFSEERTATVLAALRGVRPTLREARHQLAGQAFAEFAAVTVDELGSVEQQLDEVARALRPELAGCEDRELVAAITDASQALGEYRDWLSSVTGELSPFEPIGDQAFRCFLSEIALVPETPSELLAISRAELARAVALSIAEATRPGATEPLTVPNDLASQIRREAEDEAAIRTFYVERDILSQPETLGHYLTAPLPAYLAPIRWLGVTDDLTSEHRLDENAVSYMPEPSSALPYFYAANAHDPRCGVVHEGVHYQQLALSWRHPDPVRRHYYDSCPNEGIAFYNEELMLQAGLFDDDPGSRAVMLSFMRLRALRVEVDVRLALGDLTLDAAADYLARYVPMDQQTAAQEAASFAASPGQGLSYQLGKVQIQQLLADAARDAGESFDLRTFHDYLWLNGNVPIPLLRRELLARMRSDASASNGEASGHDGPTTRVASTT